MSVSDLWSWTTDTPADCRIILIFGSIWFALYYVDQYRRWGTLSIGVWFIGFDFFLKIVVMYPFAKSPENILDVGQSLAAVQTYVDEALRISAIGVVVMMVGMFFSMPRNHGRNFPVLDRLYLHTFGWLDYSDRCDHRV